MDTEVTLTVREQKRLFVITEVFAGRRTPSEAAGKPQLSLRQMQRIHIRPEEAERVLHLREEPPAA